MVGIRWFDRKFEFDHLSGTIGGIIERLDGTSLRLNSKLKNVTEEFLTRKKGDSWSIQEHVGHLLDLEPLWLGRVYDIQDSKTEMRAADLENRKTHEADHNASHIKQLLEQFSSERDKLVEALRKNSDHADQLSALHPRLKTPMRLIDLAYFVAEHDDHHLSSVQQLLIHFKREK